MSDLLIKGMEMPKKSGQYVLYLDVYGDPPARPPDVHMADCVRYFVFEVPPHGRLIDADMLLEEFDGTYKYVALIKKAPTVIEAEEDDDG